MANENEAMDDTPDSPRSPRSERQGAADEGTMEPGKGEPHEDEEEEEDASKKREAPGSIERGITFKAEAFNQNDGRGEMSEQREVLKGQYQLGYPGSQRD